ncbi:MAG TPA: hypothetical protein VFY61_02730 [Pyrinomonadaceae bacterium]|nr:hypothetical protein [Pyrinomonadaceae bacterium]
MKSFFLLILLILLPQSAAAHRLDEYLQAAQINLTPTGVRIELRLTPGVDVADRIYALIDLDRNGQTSPAEQRAYAQRVLDDLALELDNRPLPLTLTSVAFPSRAELKTGDSAIILALSADTNFSTSDDYQLTFRNNHLPTLSVYNANTLIPTALIKITSQQRDPLQHELTIHFHLPSTTASTTWPIWRLFLWLSELLI